MRWRVSKECRDEKSPKRCGWNVLLHNLVVGDHGLASNITQGGLTGLFFHESVVAIREGRASEQMARIRGSKARVRRGGGGGGGGGWEGEVDECWRWWKGRTVWRVEVEEWKSGRGRRSLRVGGSKGKCRQGQCGVCKSARTRVGGWSDRDDDDRAMNLATSDSITAV